MIEAARSTTERAMRRWLAPLALMTLLSSPAAARDGTVTGTIVTLDTYYVDGREYQMILLKAPRVPWVLPYLLDGGSEVLVNNLAEGMRVTIVYYEATADRVVRTIKAASD